MSGPVLLSSPRAAEAPPRFPLFDGLRAIAALAVVLSHVTLLLGGVGPRLSNTLTVGVTIFFVVSGFLLYRPFVAGRAGHGACPRTGVYLVRRALRVVPAYWVALAGLAIFPGLVFREPLAVYLLFGQSFVEGALTGIPVAWSLSAEVSFYLALPLLARGLGRTGRYEPVVLLAAVPLTVAFVTWLFHGGHDAAWVGRNAHWQYSILGTLDWFALGMLLAWASVHRGGRWLRRAAALGWPLAALLLGVSVVVPDVDLVDHVLFAGIAVSLIAPAVADATTSWPGRLLSHSVVQWLGLVSYGIFLWHLPLVTSMAENGLGGAALLIAGLAAAIACGAVSYYVVERPFLALKPSGRRPPG